MAATGARVQKPVGSAAWTSSEKENCMQLVNQELEEVEFPVRYEMEWLNEHMAEVFSSNQFNLTEIFKTPGKLRGKTPRTIRKRNPDENRVPLSEIFSSVQKNRVEKRFSPSPAAHRSPTKAIIPPKTAAPTPPTKAKNNIATSSQPQYPDLTQNFNSFSQYNTDSGYHGMGDEDDDDDLILTQVAPESQPSTQPFDAEPMSVEKEVRRRSADRRTTDASFHSAHEDVRPRPETVEPMNIDSPIRSIEEDTPQPERIEEVKANDKPDAGSKPAPAQAQGELRQPEIQGKPADAAKSSSPMKPTPALSSIAQPSSPHQEEKEPEQEEMEPEGDDIALDNLDDIGSPSDGSTPDRPPIRKSSLSFASLPAREPLTAKSLGGSRLSRTSHVDLPKPGNAGRPSYFGRQTGGHRTTQTALEENSTQPEKMDIDEIKEANEYSDTDSRASKLHNKSSTQRLHEKISMLGKLPPSRPTKSIPSVALSTAQVSYPELPPTRSDTKVEVANPKSRETPAAEPMPANEEDWIKPLSSPTRPNITKAPTAENRQKPSFNAPAYAFDKASTSGSQSKKNQDEPVRPQTRQGIEGIREKSSTPIFSSPRGYGHQKSASVNIDSKMTTTPISSPRQDGPLSASKSRLQSIVRSAKGLFTSSGGVSAAARIEASSPQEPRAHLERTNTDTTRRPLSLFSPPRQEGRRTRSSTEKEEKRKQQEIQERKRKEEVEKTRQENVRVMEQKAARERSHTESEVRPASVVAHAASSSPSRVPQIKSSSKEPDSLNDTAPKVIAQPPAPQQQPSRQNDRRPTKPTRELQQKSKPQPVSIRVNSGLSRQLPLASSVPASAQESSATAVAPPPSASKPPTLKKKASNASLHTASSNSSFKSSASSQTQRKAQLASERKREQEELQARRKEEQKRELERKRQQQEEARRQDMRSRAEVDRRERVTEDPKKAAQMQAIEKRRLENARRLERQGSQQPPEPVAPSSSQRSETGAARPPSRLGSVQPFGRSINQPQPNPAKPPKRGMDEEANPRPATAKSGAMQPSGETKRRRTGEEQNRTSMRPTMGPPIRQSNIRKESTKPSIFGHAQHSAAPQAGSSIFKPGQAQRPGHPMDMAKYTSGKIPFAESSNAPAPAQVNKTPGASYSQKAPPKPSPKYPNGENIHLPEIATDSEDEDSEAEMLPKPDWAETDALRAALEFQAAKNPDEIFGPMPPFSLEEAFKTDKKIKKFRDRTSSANWSGPDGLTQAEIRYDAAERQRLRLNGEWRFQQHQ